MHPNKNHTDSNCVTRKFTVHQRQAMSFSAISIRGDLHIVIHLQMRVMMTTIKRYHQVL